MALIQIRVSDDLKNKATKAIEKDGLNLSVAIRMFLKQCVEYNHFPFEMFCDEDGRKMIKLMREIQEESVKKGTSKMTLKEINEEIRLAREERRKKQL